MEWVTSPQDRPPRLPGTDQIDSSNQTPQEKGPVIALYRTRFQRNERLVAVTPDNGPGASAKST